jgi:sodium-coupled neutral amino acid transporter 9
LEDLIFAYAAPVLVHVCGRRGGRHPLWNHIAHGVILAVGVAIALAQFVD